MARKKEPGLVDVNRKRIVNTAKKLFSQDGVKYTKMDEIARQAGMSKSTLYVYFESKEAIEDYIVLDAMKHFYLSLEAGLKDNSRSAFDKYMVICHELVRMKQDYPMSFDVLIEEIPVSDEVLAQNTVLRETFEIGEKINILVAQVFAEDHKETKYVDMAINIFINWGSLCGLITLAENKEKYIQKTMGITKEEFLQRGFLQLYHALRM